MSTGSYRSTAGLFPTAICLPPSARNRRRQKKKSSSMKARALPPGARAFQHPSAYRTVGSSAQAFTLMTNPLFRLAFFVFALIGFEAFAQAQTPFYQGKTITIIVGYQAGDGYDIWARLLVAHMGKHIPGNPAMIAQNMPGAGSMIAANHIYNVAKPDGLTMAAIGPSLYLDQVVGKKEVQFDWAKFGWVGSTENTPWLFYMSTNTPYKTIDDVRKAKEAPKCSATSTGTSGHFIPKLVEEAFGPRLNVLMGY